MINRLEPGIVWAEWIQLVQNSDHRTPFVMPHMLDKLQDVVGKNILNLGCGEGSYAGELARRDALVTAVGCNDAALTYFVQRAREKGLSICHFIRNSNDLDGFVDNSSDMVLYSMMPMDCANLGYLSGERTSAQAGWQFVYQCAAPLL